MNKTNTGTDKVEYAYNAAKTGTYHVVATYRSGDEITKIRLHGQKQIIRSQLLL